MIVMGVEEKGKSWVKMKRLEKEAGEWENG